MPPTHADHHRLICMNAVEKLALGGSTSGDAIELFDSLEPVGVDFMIGDWKGEGFQTNHHLDGLLEAYHWRGKRFESTEEVHPLVFSTLSGRTACVNPALVGWGLRWAQHITLPKWPALGWLFQLVMPLLSTPKSRARLRMTGYRGKFSATMILRPAANS